MVNNDLENAVVAFPSMKTFEKQSFSTPRWIRALASGILSLMVLTAADAAGNSESPLEILNDSEPTNIVWSKEQGAWKTEGGYNSEGYLYVGGRQSPVTITGLSIPIRENPGEGEYRYLSFAWRRWGDGTIALQLDRDPAQDGVNKRGARFDYRFDGGTGPAVGGKALRVSDSVGGGWQPVTSDLWKDFGDFTITGITLIANTRDAGFDAIYFARAMEDFSRAAPVLQAKVAEPTEITAADEADRMDVSAPAAGDTDEVKVDWAAQIKSGGVWMYPLYLCALAAIVIAIQRLLTVRGNKLAPATLKSTIRDLSAKGAYDEAAKACARHPSGR